MSNEYTPLVSQQRRERFIQASSTPLGSSEQSSLNLTLTAVFTPSSEENYWPRKEFLIVEKSPKSLGAKLEE